MSSSPAAPTGPNRRALKSALAELSLRDEHRLRRRLERARDDGALTAIAADIDRARDRLTARAASVPAIVYPETLPVSARRDDIAAAIAANQVVIVAGETGSGKTTQIPKICLELGRGIRGMIGHTQPRRLAARTVAERIAEELGTELGDVVGYTVRFTDQASPNTLVKLMTDGILLAEIQRDRLLRSYDTIIIDEAHERSLNIDFLLGYLRELLPRRPDLKVIITSATIDPELFARHFSRGDRAAPIVEVSGRSYPVEVRYQPLTVEVGDQLIDRDPVDAVGEAVLELCTEGDGDILVFLSGEREIRDTADALRDLKLPRTEIVPLYARLSAAEQHKVFESHTGRRVVLSTNVAETSLTVPGIRYVVDPGTARISRYSVRTKVQRLPIEPISQASARQRAGRCGRVADGICIRLYSEEDFEARPVFTEPEILRTNLAAVILQMTALGLGDIESFPFVEPPDRRSIRDGIALLEELGAITTVGGQTTPTLTPTGRELAQLPVDPRMARMLVEGHRGGCLQETLVIVAALSIQDVRERPVDQQQAADASHARFNVPGSDFLAFAKLWEYLGEQRKSLSSNQFRKMCRAEFLHWLRIREWQDLHGQLRTITRGMGWTLNSAPAEENSVHRALLAGMLSHIGQLDERGSTGPKQGDAKKSDPKRSERPRGGREYLGARGAKFAIFPGSSLARKPPSWVMAAELVETSRLWGRMVGRIEPEWAETLAPHLVKRTYSEPHWSAKRGAAMAYERVTLYGVPLVARRLVPYAGIDPDQSRELFIRHALVHGEWQTNHRFFQRNRELIDDVAELESRARRRDILVDDETLFEFYDERVGPEVVSARHFDTWWKQARRKQPDLLDFTPDTLVNRDAVAVLGGEYPDAWRQGELQFALRYNFEPGADDDGVTVRIPVAQLAHVRDVGFDWLVPGLREELAAALVKSLPKQLRRNVVPAPDFARAALATLTPRAEPLHTGLARELSRLGATPISAGDFDPSALPDHLRMTFAAVGPDGEALGTSRALAELKARFATQTNAAVAAATAAAERAPATVWTSETLGTLEPTVTQRIGGQSVTGYPALVPETGGVAVRVLSTAREQSAAMRTGVRELILRAVSTPAKSALAGLGAADRLVLSQSPYVSLDALVADCRVCAVDEFVSAAGDVRTPEDFDALLATVRPRLAARVAEIVRLVLPVLRGATQVRAEIGSAPDDIAEDVRDQLANLVFDGFVADLGAARLRELPRYLEGALVRLQALPSSAARDRAGMTVLDRVYAHYERLLASLPSERAAAPDVLAISWLIEELRISLFAQRVGTPIPVSEKRIERAITAASR
ncbi:ATP-dependent RNA helicase HrpA [Aldersonia sp. NBC_00410]|uniref:ATP-dependent RNA helicase HrpA n=1 Tax=Aldersonia sp. NBC_00410 TaxID=2975954 RepID=UPI002253796D|nr:ATP-dependent RNA helicase HrpA [Aldersonia sp. NBC_00410]MCX5045935.1 ATP-dependent RNA helicase HrpA [Aldersonia sp. NBC_00410]